MFFKVEIKRYFLIYFSDRFPDKHMARSVADFKVGAAVICIFPIEWSFAHTPTSVSI